VKAFAFFATIELVKNQGGNLVKVKTKVKAGVGARI
jgi:hypothetical protein